MSNGQNKGENNMKVNIGKDKLIYDYTEDEVLKIKEDLTLENPAYKQALRYSKWGKTKIPKHLFYYTQLKNAIVVPRGYNIPFEHSIEEDNRIECQSAILILSYH